MPAVRDSVTPTELEERIFKTLKAAAANIATPVTLRCAGGWVRDKLLGLDTDSPDIDVALDSLTGADFGTALQRHLQESCDEVARSVVIESNPEQSKHLETARIKVWPVVEFMHCGDVACRVDVGSRNGSSRDVAIVVADMLSASAHHGSEPSTPRE